MIKHTCVHFICSKETYKVKCKDVGQVTELVIWHDGSGFASSWYLDKVSSSELPGHPSFLIKKWSTIIDQSQVELLEFEIDAGSMRLKVICNNENFNSTNEI